MAFYQNLYGQNNNSFIPKGLLDLQSQQIPQQVAQPFGMGMPAQQINMQMPQMNQAPQQSGLLSQAKEFAQAGLQQAATAGLAAMGVPPQLAQMIAGKVGGKKQPDMPLQIQEMTPMQFQQPQQVANGATQYVQTIRGLLG